MKPTILFITCEHAVNTVPKEFLHLFKGHESLLETHRGIDFGALEIAQHLSQALKTELVTATISRLVIDCNRSLNHPHCFSELTKPLSHAEKQKLIDDYYAPYRKQAESMIQRYIDQNYQVFHLSSHSFTPVFKGVTRNASIGLLYDPTRHGEKEVAREWRGLLTRHTNYRVRLNYPYRGSSNGFTTELRRKHKENEYVGIELEINQTLTKDRKALDQLIPALTESVADLLQLL